MSAVPQTRNEPQRFTGFTEKIAREKTGLNGSLFVHVDIDMRTGAIHEITFSEKAKDGSTLDNLLGALGVCVTDIMHELGVAVAGTSAPESPTNPNPRSNL